MAQNTKSFKAGFPYFLMAGTCNDCGASTWGRYRLCPDCRKARKRKGRHSSNGRSSGSGERWVCNSCGYGWRSKKSFGNPAVCPRCKESDIIPHSQTPEGKAEAITKRAIVLIILCVTFGSLFYAVYTHDIKPFKVNNLPSEASALKDSCYNLIKGYDNIKETSYFNNKTLAINHYLGQDFTNAEGINKTQSYLTSICRLEQINADNEAIVYFRSVWWRSPLVCTANGLFNSPCANDVNDKP
ncbi:MAG: hypothetical protein Q8P15_02670 [Nanoarchaeota archaeon]|nr:hypothetical protein [Nanoarchaeota archaeon]